MAELLAADLSEAALHRCAGAARELVRRSLEHTVRERRKESREQCALRPPVVPRQTKQKGEGGRWYLYRRRQGGVPTLTTRTMPAWGCR